MTTFDINFRGWKDRHHIKNLKAGMIGEKYEDGMDHFEFEVTYKKDNQEDKFSFYDSHYNWKQNKRTLNKTDLFYALMYRMSDAMDSIDNPDLCDFMHEFGYDDCRAAIKAFEGCKEAKRTLLNIWDNEDNIRNVLNELRTLEDKYI